MAKDMHIFSDSKVSDFINSITIDLSVKFLNKWNENRNLEEKIYIFRILRTKAVKVEIPI
ncbi:MAG: hypothetical protein U9N10_04010 [Bacillota bacterium]|nr:hypothetical protein [Bacillota bacterium]